MRYFGSHWMFDSIEKRVVYNHRIWYTFLCFASQEWQTCNKVASFWLYAYLNEVKEHRIGIFCHCIFDLHHTSAKYMHYKTKRMYSFSVLAAPKFHSRIVDCKWWTKHDTRVIRQYRTEILLVYKLILLDNSQQQIWILITSAVNIQNLHPR